jgi:hypothetical protein
LSRPGRTGKAAARPAATRRGAGAARRQHEGQRDERAQACGGAGAVGQREAHNETDTNPLTALD